MQSVSTDGLGDSAPSLGNHVKGPDALRFQSEQAQTQKGGKGGKSTKKDRNLQRKAQRRNRNLQRKAQRRNRNLQRKVLKKMEVQNPNLHQKNRRNRNCRPRKD